MVVGLLVDILLQSSVAQQVVFVTFEVSGIQENEHDSTVFLTPAAKEVVTYKKLIF